tara:strand:- start:1777 stop:2373 length:597 start_codon:yes stop_codon:yes gene_type:complete
MMIKLIATAFNPLADDTTHTLSGGNCVKTKNGSKRASLYVKSTEITLVNGSYFENSRHAFTTLSVGMMAALDVTEGKDMHAALRALDPNKQQLIIAYEEQLLPYHVKQQPVLNPKTGEIVVNAEGQPVYRNAVLAPVGTADKRESRLAKIAAPATPVVAIAAAAPVALVPPVAAVVAPPVAVAAPVAPVVEEGDLAGM